MESAGVDKVVPQHGTESDNEGSEISQFEVTFDGGKSNRRRSSMAVEETKRPHLAKIKTSCFVHGFLMEHYAEGKEVAASNGITAAKKADGEPDRLKEQHDGVQSRLLTKKQLAEMALSIRELSKRLGRFTQKLRVRNVFLLTKAHDPALIGHTRDVAEWLMSEEAGGPYTVHVEQTLEHNEVFGANSLLANTSRTGELKYWTNEICATRPNSFDIVIALGGDGTVLYSSFLFQRIVPPVLSFALGSLGFLTKFDFASFKSTLREVFNKGLTVSLRLRLEVTVMRSQKKRDEYNTAGHDLVEELIGDEADDEYTHRPEKTVDILNDIVVDRGPNPTMSTVEVFGDDYHITTVQADGVCVATPTGSTAYNLAAGGSLCHPDNPVLLVTAICAHTLSFRPIILPDTIVLRLGVPYDARASSWVSFDGRERIELKQGDYVTISASRFPFPTVLPHGHGGEEWIDGLSQTLQWNSRKRQKSFKG